MIAGGWEFVWSAYGLAWSGLTLYGLSLWQRRRSMARAVAKGPEA